MAQASRVAIRRAASNPLPLPLTPPPIEQVWWWPVPTCPAPSSSPSPVSSDGWRSGSGLCGPGSIVSRFGSARCDIGRQPPLLSRCGRFRVSARKFSCFEPPAPSCTGMAHSTSAARIPAASAHSTSARRTATRRGRVHDLMELLCGAMFLFYMCVCRPEGRGLAVVMAAACFPFAGFDGRTSRSGGAAVVPSETRQRQCILYSCVRGSCSLAAGSQRPGYMSASALTRCLLLWRAEC